jgi:hypothetical protein
MVILIRHAEKPPKSDHSPDLTPIGVERAKRIPSLFYPSSTATLPHPDYLFAAHIRASSNRPVETATPLAQALGMKLNDEYSDDTSQQLAAELLSGKYAGKVVVVFWRHGVMPELAAALGAPNPPKWQDSVFDRIWKVEWINGKAAMTELPQNLLPGDSR